MEKAAVGGPGRQRDVHGHSQGVGPPELVMEAGARVQGAPVLMNRDEQRVGIVPEDVLRTVPVVAVRVDDGDPLRTVDLADVLDHDGLDVHVAEAAGAVDHAHRMVAGGPDEGKGVVHLLLQDPVRRRDRAARRDEVGFGDDMPGVGHADMDAVDVRHCGQARLELDDPVGIQKALFDHLVLRVEQPLLPLRVRGRNRPVEGGEEDQSGFSGFCRHREPPVP